jgi:hypothetical protein
MNPKAQKIWKAFCGELIVEPTEDQAQALATAIHMIVDEYEYFRDDDGFGEMVVTSRDLTELAEELEK